MNRRSLLWIACGFPLSLAFPTLATAAQESPPAGKLPSAESVLDRYVQVTGGAAAYKRRTSEVATGTYEIVSAGLIGQLRVLAKPGLRRTSFELPRVGLIESGVKDGVAWRAGPITGPRILDGFLAQLTIRGARPGGAVHWRQVYSAVKTEGIEDVNGESAYRVVHTIGTSGSLTGFYSVGSGLMLKQTIEVAGIPVEQFFEEHSDFGGILTPTRIVTITAGQREIFRITSVEANVDIPDERFELPEGVRALLKK